jgi:hypothetical protein
LTERDRQRDAAQVERVRLERAEGRVEELEREIGRPERSVLHGEVEVLELDRERPEVEARAERARRLA